jgi:hypothetical protein
MTVFDQTSFAEESNLELKRLKKAPAKDWRDGYLVGHFDGYNDGRNRCIREYQD